MSGHSKWSTIKRKKGINDAKRGQIFTKMAKLITVAARQGGGDPEMNFKLRLVVDKARAANMPADNVERAIKKGIGDLADGVVLEELIYEAYGPGGVALIIEAVSDNKNRTFSEVRTVLTDHGGRMGEIGSVRWMFESKGIMRISAITNKEEVEMLAIEAGADDIREEEGGLVIITSSDQLNKVKKAVSTCQVAIDSADIELLAKDPLQISDEGALKKIDNLMEALDELEDVSEVYSNLASL